MALLEGNRWENTLAQSDGGVDFLHNIIVRILLTLSFLPIVICLGTLFYFVRPGETSLILHYNVYFGVDLLGIWWQAYLLPVLGILFFLGHFLLAWRFYNLTERIACYLMLLSAGMLSSGILIAGVSIAFINY